MKLSRPYNPEGRWKNGPDFLKRGMEYWPVETLRGSSTDRSETELRSRYKVMVARQVPTIISFSKYNRFKRTMSWMLRSKGTTRSIYG